MTSVNGTFSVTFLVNTQVYSSKTITATGSACSFDIETDTFVINPDVAQVIPQSGIVGTKVTILGTGYDNGEQVRIDFGTHPTITTIIASPNGTFSTTFIVSTQQTGTTNIIGKGNLSLQDAYNSFDIYPNIVFLAPGSGPVGTEITISATGYRFATLIQLDFGTHPQIKAIPVGEITANGTFSTTFIVDTQPIGTQFIKPQIVAAESYYNGRYAITEFIITPKIIVVNPSRGVVDTVVTVEGTGFAGGSSPEVIQIDFGTHQTITTAMSSTNGTFSVTFTIDTQPALTTMITATGLNSIITLSYALATSTFFIEAEITFITPTIDVVGGVVTLIGEGYGSETVRIDFGTHQTITTTIASENGTFSVTFIISTQEWGTKVVTAQGNASQNLDTTIFVIQSNIISIDRPEGHVDELLTIKGTGYKNGDVLTIHFGTKQTITTTAVGSNGTFSVSFIINPQPYGTKVITVLPESPAMVNTVIFIIRTQINKVDPSSGPPSGTEIPTIIVVNGDGFTAGETITIRYFEASGEATGIR